MRTDHTARQLAHANRAARWMSCAGDLLRLCELGPGLILDLVVRLWLAHLFYTAQRNRL